MHQAAAKTHHPSHPTSVMAAQPIFTPVEFSTLTPTHSSYSPIQKKNRSSAQALHYNLNTFSSDIDTSPVQAQGNLTVGGDASNIHAIAATGVQGMGHPLPYLDRIQAAFGPEHDLSQIQAYFGSSAQAATQSLGAEAYAMHNKIAFADPNPSLHTAAHETAHVIQQQAGVQLKGGVGEVGDRYEQNADAIADTVIQGKSISGLFNTVTEETSFSNQDAVQRKLEVGNGSGSTDINQTNINSEIEELCKNFKDVSKINITVYLKELIELVGDEEVYEFIDQKALQDYLTERDKYGIKAFSKNNLDSYENYVFFKFFLNSQKNLYKYSCTGFPKKQEGLFSSAYVVNNPVKSMNDLYTSARTQPSTGTINVTDIPSLSYSHHAEGFGKNPLRTHVYWGPIAKENGKDIMGTEMLAYPLGPDHPLGKETGELGKSSAAGTAQQTFETLTEKDAKAGHLLNNHLGGSTEIYNLAPFSGSTNSQHSTLEEKVKDYVNKKNCWMWYHVKIDRKTMAQASLFDVGKKNADTAKKSASDYFGQKYINSIQVQWGQLDKNGAAISATKTEYKITPPDPTTDKYLNGLKKAKSKFVLSDTTLVGTEFTGQNSNTFSSTLKFHNLVLDSTKLVRSNIELSINLMGELTKSKLGMEEIANHITNLHLLINDSLIDTIKNDLQLTDIKKDIDTLKNYLYGSEESENFDEAIKLLDKLNKSDAENIFKNFSDEKMDEFLKKNKIEPGEIKEILKNYLKTRILLYFSEIKSTIFSISIEMNKLQKETIDYKNEEIEIYENDESLINELNENFMENEEIKKENENLKEFLLEQDLVSHYQNFLKRKKDQLINQNEKKIKKE